MATWTRCTPIGPQSAGPCDFYWCALSGRLGNPPHPTPFATAKLLMGQEELPVSRFARPTLADGMHTSHRRRGWFFGLDHSGLYSRGRLIHGQSIHGDISGLEGEGLRTIFQKHSTLALKDVELSGDCDHRAKGRWSINYVIALYHSAHPSARARSRIDATRAAADLEHSEAEGCVPAHNGLGAAAGVA
jgi:hypothetical protein